MFNFRRALVVALLTVVAGAFTGATADADSLVFIKGGEVWISHGDGSDQRQVTGAPNNWAWPTEDDAGHILVAGGQGGVNAGVEDSPGSEIYRLNQQGASLSAPQETPGSMSTVGCPTYPPVGLRVAPDGQHYAYHSWFCGDNIVEVGTVGGSAFTSSDYMPEFVFPYWVSNSAFAISRGGVGLFGTPCERTTGNDCEWWTHEVGEQAATGYPWFGDDGSTASGFDGIAVSRDGTKFASVEDDAAEWVEADAHNVELRLWSAGGAPGAANNGEVSMPTFKCQINLPPDPNTTIWYDNAGPTFSPDGTRLAFAEPDGIHIADVSNLSNCAFVTAPLVIPGATQPFWSAADEAANAGYQPPNSNEGKTEPPAPDVKPPTIAGLTVTPRRFTVGKASTAVSARLHSPGGATVRYTVTEPAKVTFDVLRVTTGRRKGKHCVGATRALRKAPHCVLTRTVSTLIRQATGGGNAFPFSGRIGHRSLPPGAYRLVGTPTATAGNKGNTATARFTIVKPSRRH